MSAAENEIRAHSPHRRRALKALGAGALLSVAPDDFAAQSSAASMLKRTIPRSGETLPVIGLGTWQTFDVAARAPAMGELASVLKTFAAAGGKMVDSSPMYGRAEAAVGELSSRLNLRASLFLATKVWTSGRQAGIDQMRNSLRLLGTDTIDLMQVHNLLDIATHTGMLREWKQAGTIRYLGITHYQSGAYNELERLLRTRDYDFVQFNYSVAEREAETRLLPAALESGTAVIINRPFAQGELFPKVKGRPLPAWAQEFDCVSWAQFFLKYIVAHPAVTCVIPGTGRVEHMSDNLQAGLGRLPDEQQRKRMVTYLGTL